MDPVSDFDRMNVSPSQGDAARTRIASEPPVQFHVRDITNGRITGIFGSESSALASLRGRPDGRFSINNHRGKWCEVEIRGGDLYIRRVLMVDGSPAAFTKLDIQG